MTVTHIGIDLAKSVFQLHGCQFRRKNRLDFRRKSLPLKPRADEFEDLDELPILPGNFP